MLATALLASLAIPQVPAFAETPAERSAALFKQAYADNEAQHYAEALAALDEAVRLDPDNTGAWHERAYTLNGLGRYKEAIASFDEEIRRRNDPKMLYTERVFAEHRLADFVGAFADTDHDVKLQPDNPDFLLGRALATLWLGRFAAAQADVSAAADIARRTGKSEVEAEAAKTLRRIDRWRAHGKPDQCKFQNIGDQTGAQAIIADCTAAFLTAGSPARKAEMLTVRSTAWAVDGDRSSQADDLQVAAALDPGNWERHSNLGFVYVDGHHSAAGLEEFDKAIALGSGSFVTYAGRAGANYNLGNMKEAFADAKKSVEIRPNEVALIILGDLASSVEKDDKQAKYYWLAAYRLGSRDDRLKERLHSVGVDHPESEPATK